MKYIFLDIDGTLFDHSKLCIPDSAYKAVELARRAGNKIYICTGRSCCMLDPVEHIASEGAISAAGAHVQAGDRVIFEERISNQEISDIIKCCDCCDVSYILEGRKRVYMSFTASDLFDISIPVNQHSVDFFTQKVFCPMTAYNKDKDPIYKMSLYTLKQENLLKLRELLSDQYHMVIVQQSKNGQPFSSELTLRKNNKASGIRKVLEYNGGDIKDTIAIGDSLNDLEMIQECGIGIAMGNADEHLKLHADYVTEDISKDGIFKAFEKFGVI